MSFPRLWLLIGVTVFLLQVGTASGGAPDACEEPCNEESARAELSVGPETEIDLPVQQQEAEHAGSPVPDGLSLLPVHMRVPSPRDSIAVARGAMGYRVPLVVRQRVPAQIRGGVYIPAHETYVVLQPGYWEAVGTAEDPAVVSGPAEALEPVKGCWLRRLFRRLGRWDGGS